MEYLAAEVMELSGNAAKDNKRKRITPRHIVLAVRGDEELNKVFGSVTISSGGVIPHIHKSLIPKKKEKVEKPPAEEGEKKAKKAKKEKKEKKEKVAAPASPVKEQ